MSFTIGISGAQGSFSEQAATKYMDIVRKKNTSLQYLVSVKTVLESLENGSVEREIFPIENSNGGIVIEAVHAMAAHTFTIEKLFEIDVHHTLLVQKGAKTSEITLITSHDQALKQCRMYPKRNWAGVALKEYADTAQAASDLGKGILPKTAAVITPRFCADLYGLDVIEESIQDLKFNYTTFIAAKAA